MDRTKNMCTYQGSVTPAKKPPCQTTCSFTLLNLHSYPHRTPVITKLSPNGSIERESVTDGGRAEGSRFEDQKSGSNKKEGQKQSGEQPNRPVRQSAFTRRRRLHPPPNTSGSDSGQRQSLNLSRRYVQLHIAISDFRFFFFRNILIEQISFSLQISILCTCKSKKRYQL